MSRCSRKYEIVLILGFLIVIFGSPIGQIAVEIYRGERAQFTDLFRYAPSEKNLRRFERTLEEKWWGQRSVRPAMQSLLFAALRETGPKGMMGREGWMFYRPGVQYLIEPDRRELGERGSVWRLPTAVVTRRESVVRAIVRFRNQLKERGVELLVAPVPGKASVYPDMLTGSARRRANEFRSPTLTLLDQLDQRGVESVNLFAAFRRARRKTASTSSKETYYLARDTHWTPPGAKLAADAVTKRLRGLGWAPRQRREYSVNRIEVERRGDILAMMALPGVQSRFPGEAIVCEQIVDRIAGLMVPEGGGPGGTFMNQHLKDTPLESSILVLGDSFSRIYQLPEPRTLGRIVSEAHGEGDQGMKGDRAGRKRLLPGSAGFPSLLARALNAPVDYIVSDGGAATDVRQKLSVNGEILENKRVVVWEFAERDIRLGAAGWKAVSLPPEM